MLKQRIENIYLQIEKAYNNRKIDNGNVQLVAVSKNYSTSSIIEAMNLGVNIFGESKVQEAILKKEKNNLTTQWHLIGHLQTNKVKQAIQIFRCIQSVDSDYLALKLNREAEKINKLQEVLIQINIGNEKQKYGIDKEKSENLIEKILLLKYVKLKGLMAIAPYTKNPEEIRRCFSDMNSLFQKFKNIYGNNNITYLSMGMSSDFQIAIEEGSNMVRIGSNIFGARF